MARWLIRPGDLLDAPADVLVCSANVFLTLTGGVGGSYLLRHGPALHEALQQYLRDRGVRHVARGTVVETPPCGGPYRAVLHAVAVDAMYESSPAVVAAVVEESLRRAAALGARSVALAALATGYGRLSLAEFAAGVTPVMGLSFPPVGSVTVGVRHADDAAELLALLPGAHPG